MKIYRIASRLGSKLMWLPSESLSFGMFNEKPDVVNEISKSMLLKGWDKNHPVFVYDYNGEYTIMNGHHRVSAADEINLENIYCLVVNSDVATNIEMQTDEITEVENMARVEVGLLPTAL